MSDPPHDSAQEATKGPGELLKQTQAELLVARRAWETISACHEVLIRAEDETKLIQRICEIIVEQGGYRMAWLGFPVQDEARSIMVAGSVGVEPGYVDNPKLTWSATDERGCGPSGLAIRSGEINVCNDFQNDPRTRPWRQDALKSGYASCIALPLKIAGQGLGVFSLYAKEINAFGAHEISVLSRLSDDLAFGIHALRNRAEREWAACTLRQNEAMLRESQRIANLGSYVLDVRKGTWTSSEILDQIFGIGPEYNRTIASWSNLIHPGDRDRVVSHYENEVLGRFTRFDLQYRIRRPADGAERWVHGVGKLEFDGKDQPLRMVGAILDITENKQKEEDILSQGQLSQALLELPTRAESLDEPELLQFALERAEDISGSSFSFVTFVNEGAAKKELVIWSGRSQTEFGQANIGESSPFDAVSWSGALGKKQTVIINSPTDLPRLPHLPPGLVELNRLIITPVLENGQAVMRMGLGNRLEPYTERQASAVQLIANLVWRVVQRRREAASRARLDMAIEQASDTIVITDAKGLILYANPAFERTSGYSRAEALGKNPRLLKSGRQDEQFYQGMWMTLARGEVWQGHFSNRRKDGGIYEEDATISPIRDADGTIVNYVAVKRDVTRLAELESQLRQSQKMEAFGQLAGGVAHDFNNMLAIIQMQADLLGGSETLSAEQKEYLQGICATVDRATALTRQLLLFSRKETIQARDLDLNESVSSMIKMLQRALGETIEMHFHLPTESMFIHADPGMIDQVVLNLSVNARDAMPGGGDLTISTRAIDFDESVPTPPGARRPGSFVCLSVQDTGCGIPREILPKIFEPFFTTKEIGKGTGLGLATVFGIIESHHGWINVESEVGKGTRFLIYLPRLKNLTRSLLAQKMLATAPTGSETILLVEDELQLRTSTRQYLTRLGYHVLEAASGPRALDIYRQNRDQVALLLTDLVMPEGMSGKELAQALLRQDPNLPVIYMSGYSTDVAAKDLLLKEAINFIAKPFQSLELANLIRKRLAKSD